MYKETCRCKGKTATAASNQACSSQRQTQLEELADAQKEEPIPEAPKAKHPSEVAAVTQGSCQQPQLLEQAAGKRGTGFPKPWLPLEEEGPLADRYMDSGGKTDVWLTRAHPTSFITLPRPEAWTEPAPVCLLTEATRQSPASRPNPQESTEQTKVSKGIVYHNQV